VTKPSDLSPVARTDADSRRAAIAEEERDFIRILTSPEETRDQAICGAVGGPRHQAEYYRERCRWPWGGEGCDAGKNSRRTHRARRWHTFWKKLSTNISFEAPDEEENVQVEEDAAYVTKQLADIVKNQDLSRNSIIIENKGQMGGN